MRLERTAAMLRAVESAAQDGALPGPTQSFLAQYLAVVLYSEMEERVSDVVKAHLEKYTHEAVALFVTTSMADLIKRLPKSDLNKLCARFGDPFKERFITSLDERTVAAYMNTITARHDIGHRRGSNITIAEVRAGHDAANLVLEALIKSLSGSEGEAGQAAVG